MQKDPENKYRKLFLESYKDFPDRVDDPWERNVPDIPEFNRKAYERIHRQVIQIKADPQHKSRGLLILGAAGTGKTHLLMRVAKRLSTEHAGTDKLESHILFIRRPNNEEAVAQHIWDNVVISLGQRLEENSPRSQLDTMLAHVFSAVLIPEFEQDIRENKNAEQKQRWKARLEEDPYNLLKILGEGEQRVHNLRLIRNRTLKHLKTRQPDVDQNIAYVLITYCLTAEDDRKRLLMEWLRGEEIEEDKAKQLGLYRSWVLSDETSTDTAIQQEREKFALKAIQTIGILSTYYRPLILAFDQLEGLRDKSQLTHNWGDVVREIFTMTPNLVILTCIFPDLWKGWFLPTLDRSVSERIAQSEIELDVFSRVHGRKFLETNMALWYREFQLPSPIYPFTEENIDQICTETKSPRQFLQRINRSLEDWIWDSENQSDLSDLTPEPDHIPDREEINTFIGKRLNEFKDRENDFLARSVPTEDDYFGRLKTVFETIIACCPSLKMWPKAVYDKRVMPKNIILFDSHKASSVCIGILNSGGISFTSRMKNMMNVLEEKKQFKQSIMIRDKRCKRLGARSIEYIEQFQASGGKFHELDQEESAFINAIYDVLIAIEESDMTLHSYESAKRSLWIISLIGTNFQNILFSNQCFVFYHLWKKMKRPSRRNLLCPMKLVLKLEKREKMILRALRP